MAEPESRVNNMGCVSTKNNKPKKTAPSGPNIFLPKLQKIPFLQTLSENDLCNIANNLQVREFKPQDYLMKEGDVGHEFFIILDGTCTVLTEENGVIAELHAGDYCGEQALLNDCERTASIQALCHVQCVTLQQRAFKNLLGEQSQVQFANRSAKRAAVVAMPQPVRPIDRKSLLKPNNKRDWLLDCVGSNLLFETMTVDQKYAIIDRMHKNMISSGVEMIVEGEDGDEFYVIDNGEFDVYVKGEKVATLGKGKCCGELALLYDAPRNATVKATCDSVVWCVQRADFRNALQTMYERKDAKHMELLRKLEIFHSLLTNELHLISDACTHHDYKEGEHIVKEGEQGDRFYMIMEGEATWSKSNGTSGSVTSGYFGELALMNHVTRQATIIAKTDMKTLELKRADFVLLLGPVEDIMKAKAKIYKSSQSVLESPIKGQSQTACPLEELKKLGVLGRGAFGYVTLVEDPHTEKIFALKAIRKTLIVEHNQENIILREKHIMKRLRHKRLVNCFRTYRDEFRVFFLLDACLGGELFTILRKKRYFSERTGRFYAGCVIQGFEYMHSKDIIYRDLKPENLVLELSGYVKIADFGFAKHVSDKTFTLCGTPDYLAPEIVTGQGHGKGVDWWTLGVLIYEMLASVSPFYASDPLMMYRNIVRGKYKTPKYFSDEVADMVKSLLCRRATKRLGVIAGGATTIKKHPWFCGIDWDAMTGNRYNAPFVPKVSSPRDYSNFKQVKDDSGPLVPATLKSEKEFEF
jgi:cGMP-dependent protein kinase